MMAKGSFTSEMKVCQLHNTPVQSCCSFVRRDFYGVCKSVYHPVPITFHPNNHDGLLSARRAGLKFANHFFLLGILLEPHVKMLAFLERSFVICACKKS